MKEIDLEKSIYELTEAHPELIQALKELGFAGAANPVVRRTLGRTMTLPEGCRRQGRDLAEVLRELAARGFRARGAGGASG